ncbi:amylo-alpha-1,6-glucosidase [Kitasatospora gansuensis]
MPRSLDALGGLLVADADRPTDLYPVSGAPWRLGLTAADALWAARLVLPLGTRLAAGTLRALARRQPTAGPQSGVIPGVLRHAGPELPPSCTATEATLLFVTLLAEAWRWGLPRQEVADLLPAAERALAALRANVTDDRPTVTGADDRPTPDGPEGQVGFVTDLGRSAEERAARPVPARCEVQAQAHRAALHGAELLEAFGRPGAQEWRDWAAGLRDRFRDQFWIDDLSGGRPAAALVAPGRPLPAVASSFVHLLDLGLVGAGAQHEGLLDREQTRILAQRLVAPEFDCGWGLRTLSAKSPRFNPLGHRSGASRVHETVLAITGLAEAGFEREARVLLDGLLDAATHFEPAARDVRGGAAGDGVSAGAASRGLPSGGALLGRRGPPGDGPGGRPARCPGGPGHRPPGQHRTAGGAGARRPPGGGRAVLGPGQPDRGGRRGGGVTGAPARRALSPPGGPGHRVRRQEAAQEWPVGRDI